MKSKLAVTSFVLSIIGLCIPFLLWALSNTETFLNDLGGYLLVLYPLLVFITLILSIISIVQIKKEKLGGMWMAVSSLIISVILLILVVFFIVLLVAAFIMSPH